MRTAFERAVNAAGIESFRYHDLRHCTASYLAMNGATMAEIAGVLGHKTLAMAKRYSHLSESHVSGVLERMNREVIG
jgi:site-specific recombinase XerD